MLKWVLLTPWVSPHQIPLAKKIATLLGEDCFRYWYLELPPENHKIWGWDKLITESWFHLGAVEDKALQEVDVVMSGIRALDLFDARLKNGKTTLYCSERWFKPPLGFLRVFVPSYFRMVRRFLQAFASPFMMYLPMGIHAARDMLRLYSLFKGDLRCLFCAPKVAFESHPGGTIVPLKEAMTAGVLSQDEIAFGKRYGFVQIPKDHWGKVKPQGVYAKMRLWGYFVAPGKSKTTEYTEDTETDLTTNCTDLHECTAKGIESTEDTEQNDQLPVGGRQSSVDGSTNSKQQTLNTVNSKLREVQRIKVLWVGRMLDWKRVDVLVKACLSPQLREKVELHLYGHGPEEKRLRQLAKEAPHIYFHDFVPVEAVRELMQQHDVYVLPSDGGEGWGAVVSEALEEGMKVLGTTGAGSSATILPPTHLFKTGDVKRLIELLSQEIEKVDIGEWIAENAAKCLIKLSKGKRLYR